MRHEQLDTRVRVYLSGSEVVKLCDHAPHRRASVAIRAMFQAMLRVGTVAEEVGPHRLLETENGTKYVVVDAKHTTEGDAEKRRSERVISTDLYHEMREIAHSETELFEVNDRQIRNWVYAAAESAEKATGEPGWSEVGPHDLRRSGANWLHSNGASDKYIQQQGDWRDKDNMDPYLDSIPLEKVENELERVGFIGDGPQTPRERIGKIETLVEEQTELLVNIAQKQDIETEASLTELLQHSAFTGDTNLSAFSGD